MKYTKTDLTIKRALNAMSTYAHSEAIIAGWYTDRPYNIGEQLMLIVTEIAEAMQAERTDAMSEHLSGVLKRNEEIADALIRIFDFCGANAINIGAVVIEKILYNRIRHDHKLEIRQGPGGKKY